MNSDVRPRTLAEVVDYLGAIGKTGISDETEVRVRRPTAGHRDRDTFMADKSKQNAVKAMVVTDDESRLPFFSRPQT
ncbi:hypothetical protein [Streptomyces sp. NPDC059008]|uniref:hypothetical protein n=1 Tax=Streptomyces sp. NPDC059008 TaxID=3346693 RepID=UPI0036A8C992